jgi:hypothetical protein
MKSTHQGTCQVCGRLQMLPNGVLSKHGYDVRFGFFNGICWGTGHKPFEQAYDCVEKAIGWATEARTQLQAEVDALQTAAVGYFAPFHRYVTAKTRGERSGYREETVAVVVANTVTCAYADTVTGTYATVTFCNLHFADGKVEPASRYAGFASLGHDVKSIVLALREQRAGRLGKDIADRTSYITWQQRRIYTWKPQPLSPVPAPAPSRRP